MSAEMRRLYRSASGDTWFLARDAATGCAFVRHEANAPSGGHVTDIAIGDFLSVPQHPEQQALLRLIGTLIPAAPGAKPGDPAGVGTGIE